MGQRKRGVKVNTIGHGVRPAEELVETLLEAGVETLVDVRRFPGSRRNPQFGREALAATLGDAGIAYRHAVELGGRLSGEPGAERFGCIRVAAFRSYAARMGTREWQDALAGILAEPAPCLMCAETLWGQVPPAVDLGVAGRERPRGDPPARPGTLRAPQPLGRGRVS
jgi:uncharacterized protein (DUF488 family)